MDVSENSGTPKSSILIGCSIINHPFWGISIFGNTHLRVTRYLRRYAEEVQLTLNLLRCFLLPNPQTRNLFISEINYQKWLENALIP